MSEERFLALPESMQRQELIDGEVYVSPSPNIGHQRAVGALFVLLRQWASGPGNAFIGLSPLDVRVAPGHIVQPDLFVLLGGTPASTPIDEVPDLVIEVLSSNQSYDRLLKRYVYEQAGVREYWMVDVEAGVIEIAVDGALSEHHDTLTSDVLEGFVVHVAAVCGGSDASEH